MGFNGASTTWSRIAGERISARPRSWLQWGLDHVVEDRRSPAHPLGTDALASMGPRPRGRGSAAAQGTGAALSSMLQWGLDHVVEDRRHRRAGRGSRCRFNGASTTWSRIAVLDVHIHLAPMLASMGPRPRGRGSLYFVAEDKEVVLASMGPRPRGRGS